MATKSFLAFGCPHVPFHSKTARIWLLQQILSRQPDVIVCLGDLFEADAASVHASDYAEHDLLTEFRVGADYLESVRQAGDGAECYWLHGNHDQNLRRRDARRIPKKLRSLCDWNEHCSEFAHWKQIPYIKSRRGCLQLGQQVIFTHGFDVGVNSDELEAIQFANYVGQANTLTIRAHTHRPEPPTQCRRTRKILLPFFFANSGCMCDIEQLEYADRVDTSMWGSAVVVGEFIETKSPRLSPCWTAETIVHKYGYQH